MGLWNEASGPKSRYLTRNTYNNLIIYTYRNTSLTGGERERQRQRQRERQREIGRQTERDYTETKPTQTENLISGENFILQGL